VGLLEKAWAKLCGSYDRAVMGTVDLGFIHLCGKPSTGYKHIEYLAENSKALPELWNAI